MTNLEDLVVNGSEVDRELVGQILAPYLRLDKDTCNIRVTEKWEGLGNEEKIVLYLVAKKAMVALKFPVKSEEAPPAEVIKQTGLPSGSVYPALRSLLQQRIIDQPGKRSGYLVPNHALEKVKSMFREKEV